MELCQGVRLFPPGAVLGNSKIVDFDASAAMNETLEDLPLPDADPEQDIFLAEPFEPETAPVPQWNDFANLWTGQGANASVLDATGNKIDKKDLRGDVDGSGLLGLVVSALGWDQRRPVEKVQGVVPDVVGKDGKVLRKEWELNSEPPSVLAEELGYYYPYLPMVTGNLVAAAA